jgi:hypothetical protein
VQQQGGETSSSSRQSGTKDEEGQLAAEVAAAAKAKLPPLAYTPDGLVGTDKQRDFLLKQLDVGARGCMVLWLHGPGEVTSCDAP